MFFVFFLFFFSYSLVDEYNNKTEGNEEVSLFGFHLNTNK